jgi:hypothetical protein
MVTERVYLRSQAMGFFCGICDKTGPAEDDPRVFASLVPVNMFSDQGLKVDRFLCKVRHHRILTYEQLAQILTEFEIFCNLTVDLKFRPPPAGFDARAIKNTSALSSKFFRL